MKIMKLPKAESFRVENLTKRLRMSSDQSEPRRIESMVSVWNRK